MTDETLDDLLSGTDEVDEKADDKASSETEKGPQAEADKPEDDKSADEPDKSEAEPDADVTDDKAASGPSPDDERVTQGQLAATLAEREKRQRAERERDELHAQLETLNAQKSAPERPDELVDPEGARAFDQTQIEQKLFENKVSTSIATADLVFDDFKEVVGMQESGAMVKWRELLKQHPYLGPEAAKSASPAVFAYKELKRYQQMEAIGDPEAFRTKLEEELTAKIKAELAEKAPADPDLPESLATETSVGKDRSVTQDDVDQSLSDILG